MDTKKRLEKRTGFKGKSFEKIKFAIVRRGNYSKPRYLEDGKYLNSEQSVPISDMTTDTA